MSKKPENTFIGSVNRHLPLKLHGEKMNNPYRGGTADYWYSGTKGDLWIEYKFIDRIPKDVDVKVECSALQIQWLRGRYYEGRNVAVVVGCKEGGVILRNLKWEITIPTHQFKQELRNRADIAAWILSETGEPYDQERSRDIRSAGEATSSGGRQAADLRGSVRQSASKSTGRVSKPRQ